MLLGREHLLADLTTVVQQAAAGHGGARWIVGDAGVGKTAVLHHLIAARPGQSRLLTATGREGEAGLAWGGVEQLVGPLVAEGHDAALPDPQRAALRAALALGGGDTPATGTTLAPIVGTRSLLTRAARQRPLLVVIDDVHWLDEPSRAAVGYLATRLAAEPIALVVGGRPEPTTPPCPADTLGPLDPVAAEALLERLGITDPAVARQIIEQVGGTPLLLEAAVAALDDHQRKGRAALPEVLTVPPSVGRVAEQRLDGLEAECRTALLVAATALRGDLTVVSRALSALAVDVGRLEPAEAAGIVTVVDHRVEFSHPTLRSAAYHGAAARDRRLAHGAIGAVLTDQVASAWHTGLATLGPDAEAADALAGSGDELMRRRAPVDGARHLELAARLTPDPETAARRLRRGASALSETGRVEAALALLARADELGHDPLEAARREQLRLRIAARGGATDAVIEQLRTLAESVEDADPGLAAELWLDTLPALVRSIRLDEIEHAAKLALEQARRAGDTRLERRAEVATGAVRLARGDIGGADLLDRHVEILDCEGALAAGAFLAEVVAPALALLRRGPEVELLFDTLDRELRAAVALPALVAVLSARAVLAHGRDLHETIALDSEAIALADSIGQPDLALHAAGSLVVAAAMAGDRERCLLGAERCERSRDDAHRLAGLCGRAALHLGEGRLDEALALYEQMGERFGIGTLVIRWEPEWCEALVRSRRRAEALGVLDELVGTPSALLATAAVERIRGLLAEDDDEAAEHFQASLSFLDLIPNDVARGRTELLWGERLRRSRKRAEARAHLEAAATILRRVGADLWADRAERELVAAGSAAVGLMGSLEALTTQEHEAARRAVVGASNREIADQLFLSPRTVETHLGSVYRKLGVRNRRELVQWARATGAFGD